MSLTAWFVVILVTSVTVIFGVGWLMEHCDAKRDRAELLADLDHATDMVQLPPLPRADYLPGPPFAAPIPWDLAGAAYALGQQRADQDAVSREVEAIFAEVEHNPERWQR